MGRVLLHFGGDGAGGFVALVEVGDDLMIALLVAVLAKLGGRLVFGDEDLEADDAAEVVAEVFFGELVHVHGLGHVVFVGIDEPGERCFEGFAFHDLHGAIGVDGEIIPGGDVHFCVPAGRDIGMRAGEDGQDLCAVGEGVFLLVAFRDMAYEDVLTLRIGFEPQWDMGADGAAFVDGDQDGKGVLADKGVDLFGGFFFETAGNVH